MARMVKQEEYAEKQNEILNAAQRLIYIKGFESMSIQDIIDEIHISKGAFYHYFDSKSALLEALVERYGMEAERIWAPIVEDASLDTLKKLNLLFNATSRWKVGHKEFLFELLKVWYDDNNSIMRQKVYEHGKASLVPVLSQIIQQGVEEGVLSTPYPDHAGEIAWTLLLGLGEPMVNILLSPQPETVDLEDLERRLGAHVDALERVLGAPGGSLEILDMQTMREWLDVAKQFAHA